MNSKNYMAIHVYAGFQAIEWEFTRIAKITAPFTLEAVWHSWYD